MPCSAPAGEPQGNCKPGARRTPTESAREMHEACRSLLRNLQGKCRETARGLVGNLQEMSERIAGNLKEDWSRTARALQEICRALQGNCKGTARSLRGPAGNLHCPAARLQGNCRDTARQLQGETCRESVGKLQGDCEPAGALPLQECAEDLQGAYKQLQRTCKGFAGSAKTVQGNCRLPAVRETAGKLQGHCTLPKHGRAVSPLGVSIRPPIAERREAWARGV